MLLEWREHSFDISISGSHILICNIFRMVLSILFRRLKCRPENIESDGNISQSNFKLSEACVNCQSEIPLVMNAMNIAEPLKEDWLVGGSINSGETPDTWQDDWDDGRTKHFLSSLRSQNVHRNDNRILTIKITRNVLQLIKRLIVVSLRINNDLTDQSPLFPLLSMSLQNIFPFGLICSQMIDDWLISDHLISLRDSKTNQTQMVPLNMLTITNNIYLPVTMHLITPSSINSSRLETQAELTS